METNLQPQEELRAGIARCNARLAEIAAELKEELFGIDEVIDRVIESLRAWYVLPNIINRPVIVCLWGLTGTGKTQLTRSLSQKLGLYDRFVEVQMDGFSNGSGWDDNTISGMLGDSGIQQGEPGILVLDEFQRYRTVDAKGGDLKVSRYQDVWALLSDGRLAPSLSFMSTIEYSMADTQYDQEREESPQSEDSGKKALKFRLSAYEARRFKRSLKMKESLLEIMQWTPQQIQARLQEFRDEASSWETDYSKLLIFVCGNLDEMYEHTAKAVEDCDTDADIFHALTKRLSVIDVKNALKRRFRPEQIARLGNNHIIYPSLSRATYERLIASCCRHYADDLTRSCGLLFDIEDALQAEIYANAVFPAQGTRPLFSSIHAILSAPLVNAALWAIQLGAQPGDAVRLGVDAGRSRLVAGFGPHTTTYPVTFELNGLKQRTHRDFRALLAVHEAGHAVLYAVLFRQPPQELKINVASFDGGYNSYMELRAQSRQNSLDRICVGLGGRGAEALVFGEQACTTGAEQDFRQATADAARFVRYHGFGGRFSRTDVTTDSGDNLNTDLAPTNDAIEALLAQQYARASQLLREHAAVFLRIAKELVQHGELPKERLAEWLGLQVATEPAVLEPYADRLAAFEASHGLLQRLDTVPATTLERHPALQD